MNELRKEEKKSERTRKGNKFVFDSLTELITYKNRQEEIPKT